MGFFFLFFFSFLPALTGDLGILWKGNGDFIRNNGNFRARGSEIRKFYTWKWFSVLTNRWLYIYMLSKIRSLHLWVMNSVKGIPSLWFMITSIRFLFDRKSYWTILYNLVYIYYYREEDFTRDENMLERSTPMKYDRNCLLRVYSRSKFLFKNLPTSG